MNALSQVCWIIALASLPDATSLCLADDVATAIIPGGKANQGPNVILVITDDQGYGDLGCHGNEFIQIYFIHWPAGGLAGGRDIADLTAHIDMIPTLAGLCGIGLPDGAEMDGVNLAPLLLGKIDSLPQREIFIQFRQSSEPPEKGKAAVVSERWRLVGDSELYDIDADPGQRKNVAADHPETVQRLRQAYEGWWTDVSQRFGEFNHIILGDDAENPVRLSSFDWHTKTAWSQGQVRSGAVVNSFWAVEIARDGVYEITLRRWPEEVNVPITAAAAGGKAIAATTARLKIADLDLTKTIPGGASAVTFTVDLPKGKTQLQTWLIDDATGQSRGAYYVYCTMNVLGGLSDERTK